MRKIIPYNPRLLPLAKKLRANMTLGEVLLWNELKGKQMGYQFSRQIPIDNFIVDFFCKDLSLVIEIDGNSHYHDDQSIKDDIRQEILEKLGVKFLRFDESEVRKNINFVVNEIHYWIENKLPTPYPSQEGN